MGLEILERENFFNFVIGDEDHNFRLHYFDPALYLNFGLCERITNRLEGEKHCKINFRALFVRQNLNVLL